MTEDKLLEGLKQQKPEALEALILQYNRYVAAVIAAILGTSCCREDVEELASDVFVAVWNHAEALNPGKVKAYIGVTARNTAKSFLRKQKHLPMDDDEVFVPVSGTTPEHTLLKKEQAKRVQEAVDSMGQPDREIFLRYYYYLQTSAQIGKALGMGSGAVRARLMRGRETLKRMLCKEEIR